MGDERGIANIGLFFTVSALTLLVVRPLSGKLNDRMGLAVIMLPAYVLVAAAMFTLAGAHSLLVVMNAAFLQALGHGVGQPALQAECIRRLPDKRGVATSTLFIGIDIGQGIGPIIGGTVLSATDFSTTFTGAGALMIIGMAAFLLYSRLVNRVSLR